MSPTLLLVLLAGAPPSAECQKIRDVHALAVQAGLDDTSLRALAARHCDARPAEPSRPPEAPPVREPPPVRGHPPRFAPPPDTSDDCVALHTMVQLARIAELDDETTRLLQSERDVTCGVRADRGRFSWPNGVTARSSSGSWSWPNGVTARSSSGSWSWPNGVTARSSSGSWSWPSGVTALSSSGRWSRPDGSSTDETSLLAQACRARAEGCARIMPELQGLEGDARTRAILELGWAARPR